MKRIWKRIMKFFKPVRIVDMYKVHEYLSEYDDSELSEKLERAENLPPQYLVYICAEILRRQHKKE